jgi:hypothetical protein
MTEVNYFIQEIVTALLVGPTNVDTFGADTAALSR